MKHIRLLFLPLFLVATMAAQAMESQKQGGTLPEVVVLEVTLRGLWGPVTKCLRSRDTKPILYQLQDCTSTTDICIWGKLSSSDQVELWVKHRTGAPGGGPTIVESSQSIAIGCNSQNPSVQDFVVPFKPNKGSLENRVLKVMCYKALDVTPLKEPLKSIP